jgi:two-component system OmpR family sensor kinase
MTLVAVLLAATSVAITRLTEANLVDQVDQQLARSAPQLRGERLGDDDDRGGPGSRAPSPLFVGVVDANADEVITVLLPETTEQEASPPDLDADEAQAAIGTGPFTVEAEDGDLRYRVLVDAEPRTGAVVVYGLPLEDVDEAIEQLMVIEAVAVVAILAALGLVTFWVLRLGVRPILDMTTAATAIGEGDLSQRVPEARTGTEAGDLGDALNQMLGRLEGAFAEQAASEERLRRFVADASHELRTPITTIRGYAELHRMGGLEERHALDEAMRRTEQEATRMGQLVGDLLSLARLDQGRELQMTALDLNALAADAVADARAVEPDRSVALVAADPVTVSGDDALIRQVLANLLGNVRVHTPPSAGVEVRVHRAGDVAVVEVADQGPGMAPEVAAHAFERFFRADPARARETGGSGLGLSIVASIVAAHQGHAEIFTAPGAGTTVRVTLPVAPAR